MQQPNTTHETNRTSSCCSSSPEQDSDKPSSQPAVEGKPPAVAKARVDLEITGLDCVDCARQLVRCVEQTPGVYGAEFNLATSSVAVTYDDLVVTVSVLAERIRQCGYGVAARSLLVFDVAGLDCADCAVKVQQAVLSLPDAVEANLDFATSVLRVTTFASASADLTQRTAKLVSEMGYSARLRGGVPSNSNLGTGRLEWTATLGQRSRTILTVSAAVLLLAASALSFLGVAEEAAVIAYALATVSAGWFVAKRGWAVFRTTRSLDMNALMTIAAVGAMIIGEWAEGATAMLLFALGNALEAMTMDRARQTIRALMTLAPQEATRIHNGHTDRVSVEHIVIGDQVLVAPGERLPVDGVVYSGSSTMNQAPITGESKPIEAGAGTPVYAGSINGHGTLTVQVTKLAHDSTLAHIVQMVQDAQSRRAPAQRFVDTFARYYTPVVILGAMAVAMIPPLVLRAPFGDWLYRALVLLVISCPCALVISTPVAIVSAISAAARNGVLVKGGAFLEAIAGVDSLAFDKTGTLTTGCPVVTAIEPLWSEGEPGSPTGLTESEVLSLAAAVESSSTHPVAKAIVDEAHRRGLRLANAEGFQEAPGHGGQATIDGNLYYVGNHRMLSERVPHAQWICAKVEEMEAQGQTVTLLADQRAVLGLITVADQVRSESRETVQQLRDLGLGNILLLSGDNTPTARGIAQQVGIENVHANLLPEDKVAAVRRLQADGRRLAMVGDGVNDAPALAAANVGIAMGAVGSDTALEAADIVLMSDDLRRIPYVVRLGRRTLKTIRVNIVLSLAIKAVFLLLAISGHSTLWMAVFADMGTSLIVTLNGMRLLSER